MACWPRYLLLFETLIIRISNHNMSVELDRSVARAFAEDDVGPALTFLLPIPRRRR